MSGDLVIVNGAVHTVDPADPHARAVAIVGGRIAGVGDDAEMRAWVAPGARVIDAGGASVLPGFVDAHNHVRLGSNPGAVQLTGATSLTEIRARIDAFADAHPDAAWVEGEGWNYTAIPGGSPTASMLEGVGRGKALFLFSYDVHTVWLNREAMARLAITADRVHLPWAPSNPRSPAMRPMPSTRGPCSRSTWPRRSGSRRSSNRRTGWTTSRCSCAPATKARFDRD